MPFMLIGYTGIHFSCLSFVPNKKINTKDIKIQDEDTMITNIETISPAN